MPLSSIFYASHPFVKKTYNSENFGRISPLLTMEHFFSKFKIMQWDGVFNEQKQPPEVFFKKRCSQKFCKIHRKVTVSESLLKERLLKKRLWQNYFPVNFVKFLRIPFLQNTPGATASEEKFFELASNKSVKTACVCIAFLSSLFQILWSKHFFRNSSLFNS